MRNSGKVSQIVKSASILSLKSILILQIVLLQATVLCSCGLFYYDFKNDRETLGDDKYTADANGTQDSGTNASEDDHNGGYEPPGSELLKVIYVIDGDTFIIENGETIRLTGINTPEIGMFFYEEAKIVLEKMSAGKPVRLERDITDRDQYGRLLRYAFRGDFFINLQMVKMGFANVYTKPPDLRYQQEFIEAERYARHNNLGLWKRSVYSFKTGAQGQKEPGIIIEVNWDAEGDDKQNMNDEYVKIKNNTGIDINIAGWVIKDSGTNIYEFKRYGFSSGSEITLFTGSGTDGEGKFYWNSNMPVWNNSTDTLYLRDSEGLLVGIFSY